MSGAADVRVSDLLGRVVAREEVLVHPGPNALPLALQWKKARGPGACSFGAVLYVERQRISGCLRVRRRTGTV